MYEKFVERLQQATELVDGLDAMLRQFVDAHDSGTLKPVFANRVYAVLGQLNETLSVGVLGDEECAADMDGLYDDGEARAIALENLRAVRQRLVAVLIETFGAVKLESQLLSSGRINAADLTVLLVATLQRIETDIDPVALATRTYSADFRCVCENTLMATEEQRLGALEGLSVHATMNALYAVYRATATARYSLEFERYARLLLRRALDLLLTPGDAKVWNVRDYRTPLATDTHRFRYSALLLRDITVVWHALTDYFDLAYLLPINTDPRSVCQPNVDDIAAARSWVRRRANNEIDTWVRDQLIRLSMYAGEVALYHADHRGQHSTPELILCDHRVTDYYRLTETAPVPSRDVIRQHLMTDATFARDGPGAQRESLHASLVLLSTFKARLKAVQPALDPTAYVVLSTDLRDWSIYIRQCMQRPMLLLMFNHVQVWSEGVVLMYNNALEALAAWMVIVERRFHGRLDGYPVGALLDDFFRPGETMQERLPRLAALNSVDLPCLGTGGVF